MSDFTQLVERCANGDTKSQRALYDILKGKLMGVCFRYSQSLEDAEDVFQETMIRVFNTLDRASRADNFVGWVHRMARNVAIDNYRKSRTEMIANIDDSEAQNFSSDDMNAFQMLEAAELVEMLQKLPYNQMLVFNMYVFDGYTHKEIGEQLGIAESSSRVLLTRAKRGTVELLKKTKVRRQVYG